MAAMTIQSISPDGATITYGSVNSADTIAVPQGDQRHFLFVKNTSGGSINVTITAQKTSVRVPGVGNQTIADKVIAVGAGAEKMIGPFTEAFIGTDGNVDVAYSATTSILSAAIKLPSQY